MEKGWVRIYSTDQPYRVEMAISILESEGIPAVMVNKKDTSYVLIGEAELFVNEKDKDIALAIINNIEEKL
jgi:hypothetical protein